MSRGANGIATELDIKYGIDNDLFFQKRSIDNWTNQCIKKEELIYRVTINESLLAGLANNRLVKWELVQADFATNLTTGLEYGAAAYSVPFSVSSTYGWTVQSKPSWVTLDISIGGPNLTHNNLNFTENINEFSRSDDLVLRENSSLKTITYNIFQKGSVYLHSWVGLARANKNFEVCELTNYSSYYIPKGEAFANATILYANNINYQLAPQGWYKEEDNPVVRNWSGSSFIGSYTCT